MKMKKRHASAQMSGGFPVGKREDLTELLYLPNHIITIREFNLGFILYCSTNTHTIQTIRTAGVEITSQNEDQVQVQGM